MFEIYVFISVIFGILTLLFSIIAFVLVIREGASKSTILSALATVLSAGFTIISYFSINVPTPVILPLNNETEIYNDNLGIAIESEKFILLETYYTLDGTDPKNGELYNGIITISKSTTVCARNKFLWLWSDVEISSYIINSCNENDDDNIVQEIESIIDKQDELATRIDDLENSSGIDDKEADDKIEIPNEFESLDNLTDKPITNTESNDVVRDIPSNRIEDITPSTEPIFQPEPEAASTSETIPIPEQPKQNTENEVMYAITLIDKREKNLSNKKFLIKCNNNVIAEVYTDSESTFYLSGSILSQPIDWRTNYELILCKENLYDENGQEISGYPISSFNITGYDTEFEILCDAYQE